MHASARFLQIVRLIGTGFVLVAGVIVAALIAGPRLAGYELLSVQSDSMRPYARTGDAVLVKKSDKTVSPGKIVSYVSPTQAGASVIVTHRVVSVDGAAGTFTAKGDNNVSADKALPLSYVVGAVQSPVPYAGYVVDMLKRPVGLIAAVYVPCALMIIAEIRRLTRHYKGQFGRSGNANSRVGQRGRRQATRHYRLHYYFD